MEPLSSSSQPTPKLLKSRFGFIKEVSSLDSNTLQIMNAEDVTVRLLKDKFSPLLDTEDNGMKKTLLAVMDKDVAVLSSTLNAVIKKFHAEEYKLTDSEMGTMNSEAKSAAEAVGSQCSGSISKCTTEGSVASTSSVKEEVETQHNEDLDLSFASNITHCLSVSMLEDKELSGIDKGVNEPLTGPPISNTEPTELMEIVEIDHQDIMSRMEDIISKAKYQTVSFENIVVPKQVKVERDLVDKLKDLLMHTPDKTQTFIGTIRHVDLGGDVIGPHEVWVNPELFFALSELHAELGDSAPSDRVYAVVHEVFESDGISSLIVGIFLNANSKDFAAKIHVKMMYNDLIRLSVSVISEENSERTKAFLKATLNSFTKGKKNSRFFIKFANLPSEYLRMFDEFLRLYEEGSIHGQGVPLKKLIMDGKKNDDYRLEIPLNFLKDHLKVDQKSREEMILKLLERKITFKEYKLQLWKSSKLSNLKSKVELIAGRPFPVLKESCPGLLSDEILEEFTDAKQVNSGHNAVYSKLVSHVQVAMGKGTDVRDDALTVEFKALEDINLTSLSRSVKDFNALILHHSEDKDFNATYEFAFKEEIKKNPSVFGIFINLDEKVLRGEMSEIEDDPDLVVDFIHVKREKPINNGGFRKDFFPISVVGHRDNFKEKEIKSFHSSSLKDALGYILNDTLGACTKVLYVFNEKEHSFDLDPISTLAKKKICVTYYGKKEDLEALGKVIDKKVI